MSLEKLNVIDFIGIEKATNDVTLTISDDLDWQNVLDHVYLLQEKINYYLSFIESGEIERKYLKSRDRNKNIKIYFKYEPREEAIDFIKIANQIINDAGFGFSCVVPDLNCQEDKRWVEFAP